MDPLHAWKFMQKRRLHSAFEAWRLCGAASADHAITMMRVGLHMMHRDKARAFSLTWRQAYLSQRIAGRKSMQCILDWKGRHLPKAFGIRTPFPETPLSHMAFSQCPFWVVGLTDRVCLHGLPLLPLLGTWRSLSDPRHWPAKRHRMWCHTLLGCIASKSIKERLDDQRDGGEGELVPAHPGALMVHPAELWRYLAHGVAVAHHVIHVSNLGSPLKGSPNKAQQAGRPDGDGRDEDDLRRFVGRKRRGEAMDWSKIETTRSLPGGGAPWVSDMDKDAERLMDRMLYQESKLNPADRRARRQRRGAAAARSLSTSPSR